MQSFHKTLLALLLSALLLLPAWVQAADYQPDIREFSNQDDLGFPGDEAFGFGEQATLEFWAAAGWDQDPGHDPVLVYHADEEGFIYVLAMLADRSGLTLQAGDSADELAFDFTDGRLHHIALVHLGDTAAVMIDGQILGRMDMQIPPRTGSTFRLGSAPGPTAAFQGALGGLRIWRIALERETLIDFALANPFSAAAPHPDLEDLAAYSALNEDTIDLIPEITEQ